MIDFREVVLCDKEEKWVVSRMRKNDTDKKNSLRQDADENYKCKENRSLGQPVLKRNISLLSIINNTGRAGEFLTV